MRYILLVLLLLGINKNLSAQELLRICDTCVAYSSFANEASKNITVENDSTINVFNTKTGHIRSFKVHVEPGFPALAWSEEVAVSSEKLTAAQNYMSAAIWGGLL